MRHIRLPIYVLRPYERGIQETFGRYSRFVLPGLGLQIPIVHLIRVRDVREHTMNIQPQSVITKDNVEILVDGVMWVRPSSTEDAIKKTFYNIDDWKRAVVQLAMTNLRQEFDVVIRLHPAQQARPNNNAGDQLSKHFRLMQTFEQLTDELGRTENDDELQQELIERNTSGAFILRSGISRELTYP